MFLVLSVPFSHHTQTRMHWSYTHALLSQSFNNCTQAYYSSVSVSIPAIRQKALELSCWHCEPPHWGWKCTLSYSSIQLYTCFLTYFVHFFCCHRTCGLQVQIGEQKTLNLTVQIVLLQLITMCLFPPSVILCFPSALCSFSHLSLSCHIVLSSLVVSLLILSFLSFVGFPFTERSWIGVPLVAVRHNCLTPQQKINKNRTTFPYKITSTVIFYFLWDFFFNFFFCPTLRDQLKKALNTSNVEDCKTYSLIILY